MKTLSKKWHRFIDNPPTLTLVKLTAIFLLLVVVLATMVNADSYLNLRNLAATGVSTSGTVTSTCITSTTRTTLISQSADKSVQKINYQYELEKLNTATTISSSTQAQLNTLNASLTAKATEISTYTAQYTYYYNLRNSLRKPKPGSTALQLGTYKRYYDTYNSYYTTYANYYYAAKASYDSIKAQIDTLTPKVSATTTARIATLNTQITTLTTEISTLNNQLKLPTCATSGSISGGGTSGDPNIYTPDTGSHALCDNDADCSSGESCKSYMCVTSGSDVCSTDADCKSGDICAAAKCEANPNSNGGDKKVCCVCFYSIGDMQGETADTLCGDAEKRNNCQEIHRVSSAASTGSGTYGSYEANYMCANGTDTPPSDSTVESADSLQDKLNKQNKDVRFFYEEHQDEVFSCLIASTRLTEMVSYGFTGVIESDGCNACADLQANDAMADKTSKNMKESGFVGSITYSGNQLPRVSNKSGYYSGRCTYEISADGYKRSTPCPSVGEKCGYNSLANDTVTCEDSQGVTKQFKCVQTAGGTTEGTMQPI